MSHQNPESPDDAGLGRLGAGINATPVDRRDSHVVSEARVQSLVGCTLRQTYRIMHVMEQGGMGTVYRGEHLRLRRPVAIKVLAQHLSEEPSALHRFRSEAEIISQLHHPHVVHILDFDTTDHGDPYIVMELLSGETLSRRLHRERIMAIRDIAQVVLQTAGGLLVAHAAGIVHRDLKPDNMFLLDMQDSSIFVKLLDFGISKRTAVGARVTGEFEVLGTPDYMAPEQIMNTAQADHRADQWSLAAITYEMLTGRIPFCADNIAGTLAKVMHDDPPSLTGLAVGVPPAMANVVYRGLSKFPADRFPTIMEYSDAFAQSAGVVLTPGMSVWPEEQTQVVQKSQTPTLGGMRPIVDAVLSTTPTPSNNQWPQANRRASDARLPVPTIPQRKSSSPQESPSKSTPPLGTRALSTTPLGTRPLSSPPVVSGPTKTPTLRSRQSSTPPSGAGSNNMRLRRSEPSLSFSSKDVPHESLRAPRVPGQGLFLTDADGRHNAVNDSPTLPAPPQDDSQLPRVAASVAAAKRIPEELPNHEEGMLKLRTTLDEIRQAVTFGESQRALAKARLAVQLAQSQRQREAKELLSNATELLQPILLRSLGGSHRRVSLVQTESTSNLSMSPEHLFLLSRVDGTTTVEELLDVSPLSIAETLGILLDFLDQGYLGID